MKTTINFLDCGICIVKTENFETAFNDKEAAATQIGLLQQEILSLRADNETLKDELEECEDYDWDEDPWDD